MCVWTGSLPLLACLAIWQQIADFERQGHLTPISISTDQIPNPLPPTPSSPFPLHLSISPAQSSSFSPSSSIPPLFPISQICSSRLMRGERMTLIFTRWMIPRLNQSRGERRRKKNTNTFRPLIAFFPPKKVKLTFRCSINVLCVLVLFIVCECVSVSPTVETVMRDTRWGAAGVWRQDRRWRRAAPITHSPAQTKCPLLATVLMTHTLLSHT